MSRRAYELFQIELVNNPALAAKFHERLQAAADTEKVDVEATFAQRHGFDVKAIDIRQARAEQ